MNNTVSDSTGDSGNILLKKVLLICGILSSLLYVGMNIFIPMQYDGYNYSIHQVSELSAIGAPTRQIWVSLGIVYTLMVAAFGLGIWKSAKGNRHLRIVGVLMIIYGVFGLFWPPMHQREVLAAGGKTLTDTLHIVWTIITVLLMMLAIGFASVTLGKGFRFYSIATIVILIFFGALTGKDAPNLEANLPTPLMGIWERINIGVFLIWVIVLAIILLQKKNLSGSINGSKI